MGIGIKNEADEFLSFMKRGIDTFSLGSLDLTF